MALLLAATSACKGNQAAGAAIATAATIAAAAGMRAVSRSCYAECGYGTFCNHDTGLCEGSPGGGHASVADGDAPGNAVVYPPDEDCGGMCLASEICVAEGNDLVCVPRARGSGARVP